MERILQWTKTKCREETAEDGSHTCLVASTEPQNKPSLLSQGDSLLFSVSEKWRFWRGPHAWPWPRRRESRRCTRRFHPYRRSRRRRRRILALHRHRRPLLPASPRLRSSWSPRSTICWTGLVADPSGPWPSASPAALWRWCTPALLATISTDSVLFSGPALGSPIVWSWPVLSPTRWLQRFASAFF